MKDCDRGVITQTNFIDVHGQKKGILTHIRIQKIEHSLHFLKVFLERVPWGNKINKNISRVLSRIF